MPSRRSTSSRRTRTARTARPSASTSDLRTTGTVRPHPRGFAFADLDPSGPDDLTSAFIPPPLARRLVDGDVVEVTVRRDDRGATATAVHRVTRLRFLAAVTRHGDQLVLHPHLGTAPVVASPELVAAVPDGAVAAVELARGSGPLTATRVATHAPSDTASAAPLVAVVRARGVRPAAAAPGTDLGLLERAAVALVAGETDVVTARRRGGASVVPGAQLDRRDDTGTVTVTIDGPTTRDIDDAISARRLSDGRVEVAVHIADAAAKVPAGSTLDRRARTLATSTYLSGLTAPMLPARLSEGALSLLPGERRDTLTVTFTVHPDGQVTDVELVPTTIVSDARLTYGQVAEHMAGRTSLPKRVRSTVDAAATAAAHLAGERDARTTFTALFTPATHTVTVTDGQPARTAADPYPDAQLLIERLMVAANESVARWLTERQVPALYRVHPGLDPARADRLDAAARRAGVDHQLRTPAALAAALDAAEGDMLATVAAFSFGRAAYAAVADRHVGLDSRPYTHFTSPIRRYADLVVHRQIRAALAGETPVHDLEELDQIARWITDRSGDAGRAEALERDALTALLLARELVDGSRPAKLTAVVSKLTPAGAQLRLVDLGVSGFLPAPTRGQGRANLELSDDQLVTRCGSLQVGQRRRVRVSEVDPTGRLLLRAA